MKKIYPTICFLFLALSALAQKQGLRQPQGNQQEFEGYTIRLLPATGGTYGYAILKGNELLLRQSRNPFTHSPVALRNKEDAYKVARWHIGQWKEKSPKGAAALSLQRATAPASELQAEKTRQSKQSLKQPAAPQQQMRLQRGPIMNQPLPLSIARELQITIIPVK